ncbi:hypothetical protein B0H13DRAFT_2566296 [Mycena leptocephala]|nr:hypothetical protein B0H13DRAFT_2566296 [Mycena leptocephala]
MTVAPEMFDVQHWIGALKLVGKVLRAPLGMKTLDPSGLQYRPVYDNSNDSTDAAIAKGLNYHQKLESGSLSPTAMEAGSMSTSTDTIRTLHTRQPSPSRSPTPSPPDSPSLSASGSSVSSFPSVSSSFFFSSAAASPPHVPPLPLEGEGQLIIPELVLPVQLIPRTLKNEKEKEEEEEKLKGPTTGLLILGPRAAAAAAAALVLRAEAAWRDDDVHDKPSGTLELVSLGEDLHQCLSLPTTTHRILTPFWAIGALLAPPVLSSPDREKEEALLRGMLEGVGMALYRALLVVLLRDKTSASAPTRIPLGSHSRTANLAGALPDNTYLRAANPRDEPSDSRTSKQIYNFKQNLGQRLCELSLALATDSRAGDSNTPNQIYKVKLTHKSPMQQSLRTLRPKLSKLRTLGGINQQQCPYRGLRPRLNVTQILRLCLEAKMINLVAATVRNSAKDIVNACLNSLPKARPMGVRRHLGFGSGFDDSGFGRGLDDPRFGFKDRGSAFDEHGSLFD